MIRVNESRNHFVIVETESTEEIGSRSIASHDGVTEKSIGSVHVIEDEDGT